MYGRSKPSSMTCTVREGCRPVLVDQKQNRTSIHHMCACNRYTVAWARISSCVQAYIRTGKLPCCLPSLGNTRLCAVAGDMNRLCKQDYAGQSVSHCCFLSSGNSSTDHPSSSPDDLVNRILRRHLDLRSPGYQDHMGQLLAGPSESLTATNT